MTFAISGRFAVVCTCSILRVRVLERAGMYWTRRGEDYNRFGVHLAHCPRAAFLPSVRVEHSGQWVAIGFFFLSVWI